MRRRSYIRSVLTVLAVLHTGVICPGFLAPYDPAAQYRWLPFSPPVRLHIVDAQGVLHFRPFVYRWVHDPGSMSAYDEDPTQRYPIRLFVRGSRHKIAGIFPSQWHLFGADEPAQVFLFGTDQYGRDQFSRFIHGGQISLLAGLLAAGLSLFLGVSLGALSGFHGKWIDTIIMRSAELFLALPWLYLLFAVRAFLPLHIHPLEAFLLIVSVVGLIGWARPARLVRGVVLSAKERNYVLAARGFGAANLYLLRRHVLPQTFPVLLTQAALLIPHYILAEVTLSFLGLGVGEPVPSWGNLLVSLEHYHVLASYWWMFLPALALIPFFMAYHILSRALEAEGSVVA